MLLIGDVHGCYKTLRALLELCPRDDICFVGDLIDRGPSPEKVVRFVREEGHHCILGNHEDMMLDFLEKDNPQWLHPENGGDITLDSYGYYKLLEFKAQKQAKSDILNHSDVQWLKQRPLYLEFPDLRNDEGRYLVASHSSVADAWNARFTNTKSPDHEESFRSRVLWGRPRFIEDVLEIYNVFGHTPVPFALIRSHYANIDTGCYLGPEYGELFGHLTALQFPQMRLFTQKFID